MTPQYKVLDSLGIPRSNPEAGVDSFYDEYGQRYRLMHINTEEVTGGQEFTYSILPDGEINDAVHARLKVKQDGTVEVILLQARGGGLVDKVLKQPAAYQLQTAVRQASHVSDAQVRRRMAQLSRPGDLARERFEKSKAALENITIDQIKRYLPKDSELLGQLALAVEVGEANEESVVDISVSMSRPNGVFSKTYNYKKDSLPKPGEVIHHFVENPQFEVALASSKRFLEKEARDKEDEQVSREKMSESDAAYEAGNMEEAYTLAKESLSLKASDLARERIQAIERSYGEVHFIAPAGLDLSKMRLRETMGGNGDNPYLARAEKALKETGEYKGFFPTGFYAFQYVPDEDEVIAGTKTYGNLLVSSMSADKTLQEKTLEDPS